MIVSRTDANAILFVTFPAMINRIPRGILSASATLPSFRLRRNRRPATGGLPMLSPAHGALG